MSNKCDIKFFLNLKFESEKNGNKCVIDWCMNEGLIASFYRCPKCNGYMKLNAFARKSDGYIWRCKGSTLNQHNVQRTIRNGSWFEKSNLPLIDILIMISMFIEGCECKIVAKVTGLSGATVTDWRSLFREVLLIMCDNERRMIGGIGKIVEVDESLFGKRKCHGGQRVDGPWVFSGIERGTKYCFLKEVEENDDDTIKAIIKQHIHPGTTIISGGWAAYKGLEEDGYHHQTVNLKKHFKDPNTGAHINTIKGVCSAVKRTLPRNRVKEHTATYLAEYMWFKNHREGPKISVFFDALKKVYPPKTRD